MKKLILCCLAATFTALSTQAAHAAFVFTLTQVGPDVIVTGSGTINTAALTLYAYSYSAPSDVFPSAADITSGPNTQSSDILVQTAIFRGLSGSTSFGSNTRSFASFSSGDPVEIQGNSSLGALLSVPASYVSGSRLLNTAIYPDATFSSLGFTPGTYTYTWGSGATADSLTVTGVVPEPSTWALLGMGGVGLLGFAVRRRMVV